MATKATQPKKKTQKELLQEKKIAVYQDRILHDEETIAAINAERSAMSEIRFIGSAVYHKRFGSGKITEQNATTITVRFDFGDKRFVMPAAFLEGFLETDDSNMNGLLSRYRETGAQILFAKNEISAASDAIKILEKR